MQSSLKNKQILICGAGGRSGQAAARLALLLGAHVLLSDTRPKPDSKETAKRSIDLRPRQDPEILSQYSPDLLVFSPGLSPQLEILQSAAKQGFFLISENDFGFKFLLEIYKQKKRKAPLVIGITGTDGKSTTTALLAEMIAKSTKLSSIPCGNFGLPLSELAWRAKQDELFYDVLVVECSSFQLEKLAYFHPHIALFLNLAQDHGDRYANLEDYFQSKLQICKLQGEKDLLILDQDLSKRVKESWQKKRSKKKNPRLVSPSLAKKKEAAFYFADKILLSFSDFRLPGLHNIHNADFALTALEELSLRYGIKIKQSTLKESLKSFKPLAHRLEYVGSIEISRATSLECYNDSKATTVQAVKAALRSFKDRPVFLLCGGQSKGDDFSLLVSLHPRAYLFPFGEAAFQIAEQLRRAKEEKEEHFLSLHKPLPDLESAFEQALNTAENLIREQKNKGEELFILLLSPGCSSFDAYENYVQRGEHFRKLVYEKTHKGAGPP